MSLPTYHSTDPEVIASGLKTIRRWRRISGILLILYLPTAFLATSALGEDAGGYVALCYMLLFVASGSMAHSSKCPRCRELFHANQLWHNSFTYCCLHCQLPLNPTPSKFEVRPESMSED